MAEIKISELAAAAALTGAELFEAVQSGGNVKVLVSAVLDAAAAAAETAIATAIAALDPSGATPALQFLADTSSTSDADPGAGNVRWNNGTQGSATILYLDDATVDGVSLTAIWPRLNAGAVLFLQHATNQDTWQIWEVTGVNDASGYAKLTATLWADGGVFADNDPMLITIDKGQGAAGGGAPFLLTFKPNDNEPPTANYATLDTRNNRPCLDFDTTTQEAAIFTGVMPYGYAGAGVTVDIFCALTSATSGTVGWDVAFERTQASTDNIDADSFATAQTVAAVTVPGTSGNVLKLSVNVSNGANMDSIAAGELFRLRVQRDVANDTATGDAELLAVTIREQ